MGSRFEEKMKSRGFTLIELLVVIAIIALLVSILLPSLQSAKNLAKRTACAATLKNFAILGAMYQTDNGGVICPGINVAPCWQGLLGVEGFEVNSGGAPVYGMDVPEGLICPAVSEPRSWAGDYGYNYLFGGDYVFPGGRVYNIDNIRHPDSKIIITDMTEVYFTRVYILHSLVSLPIMPEAVPWERHTITSGDEGGICVLWLDGHVTPETETTVPMVDGDPVAGDSLSEHWLP